MEDEIDEEKPPLVFADREDDDEAIISSESALTPTTMQVDQRKRRVTLHLDPEVLDRLKADGRGWQTRANAALRRALGLD
jgi:uncharacterized protein (DUF4415 family)